ncbi:MAG: MurR/RpiR family transcriptional regulator [Bacillota bacterium]
MERFDERLEKLSKRQQKLAQQILENYRKAAFLSAQELSRKLGVSASTLVRLAKKMGYSGYPDLQRALQALIEKQISPMRQLKQSVDLFGSFAEVLEAVLSEDMDAIQRTKTEFLRESFLQCVEAMATSKRVFILGLRSSYALAYYLWFLLSQFMDNVQCLQSGTEDLYDRLVSIGPGDLVFAISFPRYTKRTLEVASFAREAGAVVVGLTDSPSSPLADTSHILLLASNPRDIYSFVAPMSILNALVVALGSKFKDQVKARLAQREKVLVSKGVYS